MALSTQAAKRRCSFIEISNNPLDSPSSSSASSPSQGNNSEHHEYKIENLGDTVKIDSNELQEIINSLQRTSDNTTRIRILHTMKIPFTFTSADLLKLLEITASVKTRIAFINEIGPRLIDPKAKSTEIIDLFRYVDDRTQVEEVLKARAVTVAKMTAFQSPKPLISGRGGSVGGRGGSVGGRGRGGRLAGGGRGVGGGGARSTQLSLNSSEFQDQEDESPSPSQITTLESPSPPPSQSEEITPSKNSMTSSLHQDHENHQKIPQSNFNQNPTTGLSQHSHSQRRQSKIGVTNSVIKTLGLTNLDEISLEGVPLESWEVKARNQSSEVNSLLSNEDERRLQSAQQLKHHLNHSTSLENLPIEEGNEEENEPVKAEEPSVIQMIVRRFSFRSETGSSGQLEPSLIPSPLPSSSSPPPLSSPTLPDAPPSPPVPVPEEGGVVGWVKRRLSFKENPDQVQSPSTLPQVERIMIEPEPHTSPDQPSDVTESKSDPSSEGVVDWIKRRLSFQADPIQTKSTLPSSRNYSVSEPPPPLSSSSSPESGPEPESKQDTSHSQLPPEDGVIGWVKRRLSFRSEADLVESTPSTLPKRTSAASKLFTSDWIDPEDAPPPSPPSSPSPSLPSHSLDQPPTESKTKTLAPPRPQSLPLSHSHSYPHSHSHSKGSEPVVSLTSDRLSESSQPAEKKEKKSMFGWFKKKNTSDATGIDSSSHSITSTTSAAASAPPPASGGGVGAEMGRQKRSSSHPTQDDDSIVRKSLTRPSVQSLQEAKKVGFMRGIFEGITGKKEKKEESADANRNGIKATASNVPVDEKRQFYLAMKPEPSIGVDPATGRLFYSYHELVRQNYLKEFQSTAIDFHNIEEHLSEGEFLLRFNMTKEEFRQLPKWRRVERKKNLMLF